MTHDLTRILAEVSEMLRSITGGFPPSAEITAQTRLVEDLGLQSVDLANLTGRVQTRYGLKVDLAPFYIWRQAGPFNGLRVGDVIGYLVTVLDAAEGDETGRPPGQPAVGRGPGANGPGQDGAATSAPPGPCSIILNSGRCGSTLLSQLIAEEPETLSASESLGRVKHRLQRQPATGITGAAYWTILSDARKGYGPLLSLGIVPDEFRYPDSGRYAADVATVPPILRVTLPTLSADPDGLFDQLAERVPHFPRQPILQHHKMMLNLVTNLTGRRRWVERSGGSSILASLLLPAFPEAKIVYLTRNVADTARSMSRHPAFQMGQVRQWFSVRYGADPWTPSGRTALPDAADMPDEMRRLLPGRITGDAMQEVMTRHIRRFEAVALHMHGAAEQALADMKPRHLHRMRYEDLVTRPVDELTRLGEFLGFADPASWAARSADQVRAPRTPSAQPACGDGRRPGRLGSRSG
jgi:putative sulfotransferase